MAAGDYGFDDLDVLDSVGDGGWYWEVFEDGFGKKIALDGVLIGGGDLDAFDGFVAALEEKNAWCIWWGVEGDVDFDSAFGAKDVNALVGGDLCGASEGGGAAVAEVEHG